MSSIHKLRLYVNSWGKSEKEEINEQEIVNQGSMSIVGVNPKKKN